jgi:hypothetical protein
VPSFRESLAQLGAALADAKGAEKNAEKNAAEGASVHLGHCHDSQECLWCRVEGAGEGGGSDGAGVKREVVLKIVDVSDLLASSPQLHAQYEALPL